MKSIEPAQLSTKDRHQIMVGAIAPRPIAWVSTVDKDGRPNLAPYSFFNAFSSNPPIVIFSSNRRVSNNTTKDTLANVEATREVVINMVSYDRVPQLALTSVDYPADVNEFDKAGLTGIASMKVSPLRVKEAPVQMECIVKDILPLGEHGGAGNLVICEVVMFHINPDILDSNGRINPHKINLAGRLGRAYYSRAAGDAVDVYYQSVAEIGVGFDQLPTSIVQSSVLSGAEITQVARLTALPSLDAENLDDSIRALAQQPNALTLLHWKAKDLIAKDQIKKAACVLLYANSL